ncbi:MAG: amino acid adenylation domain-containing protein [Methylobacter sp.]|nr:amino acid adenylation domain-containing protein [Methylobacter sp.]
MKIILPDQSIKLPEPPQRSAAEQFLESAKLRPEIIKPLEPSPDYWKRQLAEMPTLELPTDKPRPSRPLHPTKTQPFSLTPDLAETLKTLSRREGVTLFVILAAALQVLLHRYTGQDDIALGTPSGGPSCSEPEDLLATLVLRTNIAGNPRFRALLPQVREVTLGAYTHQEMPLDKFAEALSPQRDLNRHPLCQVLFALQNSLDAQQPSNESLANFLPGETEAVPFELAFTLSETPHGLSGTVRYATDLFERATIERLTGHFQTLLEGIVADPDARLSELPLLTEAERRQLLVEWNDTAAPFPADTCIHELFEAQVAATPQAVALIHENSRLSYAELNARANRLAHYLREVGVKPDVLVAICVERGLNMIVGLLAILKAGGAYLPLDPAYPEDRLVFMLEDSVPIAVLTQDRFESLFVGVAKALPLIDLEAMFPVWAYHPDTNPDRQALGLNPKHLAYVIYTSGSTGKPKGVMIEHQGLCSMITDLKKRYHMETEDRMLQFATIAFDVSVEEIFVTLLSGAALLLRTDEWLCDASAFWTLCQNNGVSIVNLPTLFWQQLAQEHQAVIPSIVRHIIIGGDAVSSKVLADWFGREGYRPKLLNAYGPTETTVNATIHEPSANALSWQSIGRPIANTQIYILDANRQPVPIGVAGELFIGGIGIARGYLKRPELTAERFIADPFAAKAKARMYKTGDLARWLADGTIEFLGRNDFQVKIRGFRIELGDIETKLAEHPAVREVAVLAYEDNGADKQLVAYPVPQGTAVPSISELREFLKPKLPEFMIPSAFMFLDALPLTPNGKLDRKALPKPDANCRIPDAEFTAPRNPLEQQLVDIWTHVLQLDRIGIHDNFFALGGHSLLAVKMVAEVNKQLNTDLVLGVVYQAPTIEELSLIISFGAQQPFRYSVVPIQMQGSRPPLFAIHTITLLDLPRHLGRNQPLYFLRYGMAGENSDHPVSLPPLKDLARHYIGEMQLVQPQGPYYLIGFSFGGMIAYEMAQQLLTHGHQVKLLGLLDTHLTEEQQILPLTRIIRKFLSQGPRELMNKAKTKINDWMTLDQYGTDFWPHVYTSTPDTTCRNGYQADSYPGRVTLFQASERESLFFTLTPPEHEWQKLLGDKLDVQQVSGQHFDMCREPHVQALAAKITACMNQVISED